jgi:hypothetical protein
MVDAMTTRPRRLWVVCPVYLDVESFLRLRLEVRRVIAADAVDGSLELHFVVVEDTAGQDPEITRLADLADVRVIVPPFNLGHQRAIVHGLRVIRADIEPTDIIVTMDADGEDQPGDLPRLLAELRRPPSVPAPIVLAQRTKRRESPMFKVLYFFFKLMFRSLTGTSIRTGNLAAYGGWLTSQVIHHPNFDLCYSSSLVSLNLGVRLVPCERGERYAGQSRMGFSRLVLHGIRMLMPFIERIAVRALILFGATFALGMVCSCAVVGIKLFTSLAIPGWTSSMLFLVLLLSSSALGNFILVFILFSMSNGLTLRSLHASTLERQSRVISGANKT